MCNLKTVGTLCESQVYCGRKMQSACEPMRPPSSRHVIHINYVFHNVVNRSCPQLSLSRKNNNLFYSQSWCHHLLLRNMSTCGMFQTAVFCIPSLLLPMQSRLVSNMFDMYRISIYGVKSMKLMRQILNILSLHNFLDRCVDIFLWKKSVPLFGLYFKG